MLLIFLMQLSIPGCLRLSVEGLINSLKALKLPGMPGLKTLKLGRLFIASPEQFDELRFLVGADELHQLKARKLKFYHHSISSLVCDDDDDSPIDIEMCSICQKCRLVFDCSLESCRSKGPEQCRACNACIPRCVQCGRCISNCEYVETFCLEYVCSTCWKKTSLSEDMQERWANANWKYQCGIVQDAIIYSIIGEFWSWTGFKQCCVMQII